MTETKSPPPQRLRKMMETLQRVARAVSALYHLEALEEPIEAATRAARELAIAVQAQDAARLPLSATDQAHRLPEILRVLERTAPSLGLAQINSSSEEPKLAAAAGAMLRELERPLRTLEEAVQSIEVIAGAEQQRRSPVVEHLDLKTRIASLVTALWLMAKRHGALNLSLEMMRIKVVEHVAPDFHRFWAAQPPEQLLGLMRYEPDVASQLQRHDVLLFEGQRDQQWRLVDGNRVSPGGAMWDLVHACRSGCCRFCGLEDSGELSPVPSLGGVLAHEVCAPYLQRCYGFARAYSSREQAAKAGASLLSERAGRTSNLVSERDGRKRWAQHILW